MAQQIDVTRRPGLLSDGFHHHGTGIFLRGKPQCDVLIDSQPGAAVRDPRPSVPSVQPVIISKQDDKSDLARTREFSHFREQPARQTRGQLGVTSLVS
jgi:hypothetical protein